MDGESRDARVTATAERLKTILAEDGPGALTIAATCLRPADLAAAFEVLDETQRGSVFLGLPPDVAGEVLEELAPELRDQLLQASDDARLLKILAEADADDAVYLLDHMDEEHAGKLLAQLDEKLRASLGEQYELPENTAGRIMSHELITLRSFLTAAQGIAHIQGSELRNHSSLYVVDAEARLVGTLGFRALVFAPPRTPLASLMEREPLCVGLEADREEVARLMQKYDLLTIPVVDHERHIKGMVTLDDIVDVVQEEATEDIHKMGGLESLDAPYLQVTFLHMFRKRGVWLSLLFLGEMMTATVMGHFEDQIAANVVLALFIPLIISSGGNSGSQATTLVIRAMALGEIRLRDWWRVLLRELAAGAALGLLLGTIGFMRIVFWPARDKIYGEHFLVIACTVLSSLIGVVLWGSISGAMLPFILRRFGFDPASASAPLVATLVDVTGLIIYFSMAKLMLGALLG